MDKKVKWKEWEYYCIIGIISLIAVFFLPMVGSEAGLAWRVPNTAVGWIVYVLSKLIVAVINILLFYCFMEQAKVNVQDDEKYNEANEILLRVTQDKELVPKSPKQWNAKQYGTKGITIFATSLLSAVGLSQALLTFDWVSMLTYLFTIIMGVIFGVLQMNKAMDYWTNEYWKYAKMVKENLELAQRECAEQTNDTPNSNSGNNLLDTCVGSSNISNSSEQVVLDNSECSDSVLGRSINSSNTTSNRFYCPNSKVNEKGEKVSL